MARRRRAIKRELLADSKFNSVQIAKLITKVMLCGKKSVAESIVYGAFDIIEKETSKTPLDTFEQALRNVTPVLQVKPRRVGGATYQVPTEIKAEQRTALAFRWLVTAARARTGKPMAEKLAAEILDASKNQGAAAKRREDLHRMAEANRAFVHYRW